MPRWAARSTFVDAGVRFRGATARLAARSRRLSGDPGGCRSGRQSWHPKPGRSAGPAAGTSPKGHAMITVSGLTKRYDQRTVVDNVEFALEPGTVTGFLGPNGAGKTTTMRMIGGLIPARGGVARGEGRPDPDPPHPAAGMGSLVVPAAVHPG